MQTVEQLTCISTSHKKTAKLQDQVALELLTVLFVQSHDCSPSLRRKDKNQRPRLWRLGAFGSDSEATPGQTHLAHTITLRKVAPSP